MGKIRLGISSCLLGQPVRYDGSHRLDRFLKETFGQYVEYVSVCPEVECGLPVPREPMRLEGDPESPRLMTSHTRRDFTERMIEWAEKRVVELREENLCGFVFKSKSPSSGMQGVPVYNEKGVPVKKGIGIFARIFMEHNPLIPVEDEERLSDPGLRENFVQRIFTFKRWREVLARGKNRQNLERFHTQHELLILSHSPRHHRLIKRLLLRSEEFSSKELFSQYQALILEALKLRATPAKNANVLLFVIRYFEKALSSNEKKELLELIDAYRKGLIPLIVPVTLLKHYVCKYDEPYLMQQVYLNPHPLELKLRYHI